MAAAAGYEVSEAYHTQTEKCRNTPIWETKESLGGFIYRGLFENIHGVHVTLALVNLFLVRKRLLKSALATA